jgi:hypothetical protein
MQFADDSGFALEVISRNLSGAMRDEALAACDDPF